LRAARPAPACERRRRQAAAAGATTDERGERAAARDFRSRGVRRRRRPPVPPRRRLSARAPRPQAKPPLERPTCLGWASVLHGPPPLFVRGSPVARVWRPASRPGNREECERPPTGQEVHMGKKLFVGNLSFDTTSAGL